MIKIPGFENYTIDTLGIVVGTKEKKQTLGKNGYYYVSLYHKGMAKKLYIHRLLGELYIPNPENKRTINHKDGVKTNNNLSNLEWATDSENIKHAYDNSLNHCTTKKIYEEDYVAISKRFFAGESLTTIAKTYNFSLPTISTYISDFMEATGKTKEFVEEKKRQKKERSKNTKCIRFKVEGTCMSTGSVRIFDSLTAASKALGKTTSGPISNALSGRAKSAYNHHWRKLYD